MDFLELSKLLGFFALSFVLVYRSTPKGQFWARIRRGFSRSPLLSIASLLLLVGMLALAGFPSLRPAWLKDVAMMVGVSIMLILLGFGIWVRRDEKRGLDEFAKRKMAATSFVVDANRRSEDQDSGEAG